ncbi:MAG: hypothetical protein KC777_07530 [Cyanobacteria bacterium HKST-UBA02]|nr:hypothetical protein [Cyanobacteria bacterium HKST-UBA02]
MRTGSILIALILGAALAQPADAQSFGVNPGGAQLNSIPGAGAGTYNPYGYNPYNRSAGFYNPNPYSNGINYPAFGMPLSTGNGFYNIPCGRTNLPMWKAPSGYYYPWAPRPAGFAYAYPMPVLIVPQQAEAPAPALPPVSVALTDMEKFLEENKKSNKLQERDVTNLNRRIKDLQTKERSLRVAGGGTLDPSDEAQLRRDLEQVGNDLSWRLNR